jgi:hypothetical protein
VLSHGQQRRLEDLHSELKASALQEATSQDPATDPPAPRSDSTTLADVTTEIKTLQAARKRQAFRVLGLRADRKRMGSLVSFVPVAIGAVAAFLRRQ